MMGARTWKSFDWGAMERLHRHRSASRRSTGRENSRRSGRANRSARAGWTLPPWAQPAPVPDRTRSARQHQPSGQAAGGERPPSVDAPSCPLERHGHACRRPPARNAAGGGRKTPEAVEARGPRATLRFVALAFCAMTVSPASTRRASKFRERVPAHLPRRTGSRRLLDQTGPWLCGIASPDAPTVPTISGHGLDVRLQYGFQGPGNGQEATGCRDFSSPETGDQPLYHRAIEHGCSGTSRTVPPPDGPALVAGPAPPAGFLGEVRHAVHRLSGAAQQDRR